MKKRITAILICVLLCFSCFNVLAAETTQVNALINAENARLTISGIAYGSTIITVSHEKVTPQTMSHTSLPTFIKQLYAEGPFSVNFIMPENAVSGKYIVYASAEGGESTDSFVFVNVDSGNTVVSKLIGKQKDADATGFGDIIANEAIDLGIDNEGDEYKANSQSVIKMLYISSFADITQFLNLYNQYTGLSALKQADISEVADCLSKYDTQLGFNFETDVLNDTRMSGKILGELYDILLGYDYYNILKEDKEIDFASLLAKSKALAAIRNVSNWVEIKEIILTSFADEFSDIDKNTKYNSVSDVDAVFKKMMEKTYNSFSDIEDAFKAATKSVYDDENKSAGGSGGHSGGGGGYTTPVIVAPDTVDETENMNPFSDVKTTHWCFEAVCELYKEGVAGGFPDGEFKGDNSITRAEFTKLVSSFAEKLPDTNEGKTFSDVADGSWYKEYVSSAYKKGIIQGSADGFLPDEEIKREDAAVIIYRIKQYGGNTPLGSKYFADRKNISDYAREAVEALGSAGIVNGSGDNNFLPRNSITRYEAVQLIYNAFLKGVEKAQ